MTAEQVVVTFLERGPHHHQQLQPHTVRNGIQESLTSCSQQEGTVKLNQVGSGSVEPSFDETNDNNKVIG